MEKIEISEFLQQAKNLPIIDVRSPAEFSQGHIPSAFNIPLFNDEERAAVGTTYTKINKEAAVLLGLEIVGKKLAEMVRQARKKAKNQQLLVHCWRGGMRSESVAWLLELAGMKIKLLNGGYKSYRNFIRKDFERKANLIVVAGMTGTGKTEILQHFKKLGQQVIDLEALANHKGSAFGALGQEKQPTNEQFENNLYDIWQHFDFEKPIFLEDESEKIGNITLPKSFFLQIRNAKTLQIILDKNIRLSRLCKEYAFFDKEILKDSVLKISKRLGSLLTQTIIQHIDNQEFNFAVEKILSYYDKTYFYGISLRDEKTLQTIELNNENMYLNAQIIFEKTKNFCEKFNF